FDFNHWTDLPFEGSADSHVSKDRYDPVAMSSGNSTNCAPWFTACSAKAVARFRFASMSWSSDAIWTTAMRRLRSVAAADGVGTCADEAGPAVPMTNSNAAECEIFIVVSSIKYCGHFEGIDSSSPW